LSAKTKK